MHMGHIQCRNEFLDRCMVFKVVLIAQLQREVWYIDSTRRTRADIPLAKVLRQDLTAILIDVIRTEQH